MISDVGSREIVLTYPSRGPVIVQTTVVLPIVTELLPSAEACVDIEAERLRSSFQRRPSWRRRVDE